MIKTQPTNPTNWTQPTENQKLKHMNWNLAKNKTKNKNKKIYTDIYKYKYIYV